ncbi:MAG: tyrosine-type recombinase/integrase [Gemmatimonadetes bacterium]|nr:tyrosine-type recombinase/integrase [Gemmatimonadota bacterium]
MSRGKKRKAWSYSTGAYKERVRVYELAGGALVADIREGGRRRRVRLPLRDRGAAIDWAREQAAQRAVGVASDVSRPTPTVAFVLSHYLHHWRSKRGRPVGPDDHRRAELWTRVLGAHTDVRRLSSAVWQRFIEDRRAGAIDARGERVPLEGQVIGEHPDGTVRRRPRRTVLARAVEADCEWLVGVLAWAVNWRDQGAYLLTENPARGLPIPRETQPRRPLATQDRFEALRAVSDQVQMEIRWKGRRQRQRSYLRELLDLANGTGRRIGAICQLRSDDLRLDVKPHGAIRWPADTDKMGAAWFAPINAEVRRALDRIAVERLTGAWAEADSPFLFPSPQRPGKPVSKDLAAAWLEEAETLAKLDHLPRGGFHMFRRKWATDRKALPVTDVAAAGGWKTPSIVTDIYQQADAETLQRVVDNDREGRG